MLGYPELILANRSFLFFKFETIVYLIDDNFFCRFLVIYQNT